MYYGVLGKNVKIVDLFQKINSIHGRSGIEPERIRKRVVIQLPGTPFKLHRSFLFLLFRILSNCQEIFPLFLTPNVRSL